MADPYNCLRCTSIGIGFYNIVYCIAQLFILSWQVKTVKKLQWEYENRQIPMNGAIDGFQARFPGLFALYTETPERRRINALFTIVLICLLLNIIHLITTTFMLYGSFKRYSNWIIPWFFTCAPLVIMCTTYAVLWWSGDVFNEQLTMSVAEFITSLAINGIGFIIVLLYFLRLTGRLTADYPKNFCKLDDSFDSNIKNFNNLNNNNFCNNVSNYYDKHLSSIPNYKKTQSMCLKPQGNLPPWYPTMPPEPSHSLNQKLKRRERRRSFSPSNTLSKQSTKNFAEKNATLSEINQNNFRQINKENLRDTYCSLKKNVFNPQLQFTAKKNPTRVSFTQSKPIVYKNSLNSSMSDFGSSKNLNNIKIHTIV